MGNNNSSTESVNQDGSNANDGDDQVTMDGNVQKKPKPKKKIYCCHVCGKKFFTNSQANVHIDVHEGRRYVCSYQNCYSIFTSRHGLKQHGLIHTGEKPFSCPVCKKTFRQRFSLKLHERVHSGAKPYVCKVCDQRFSSQSNLQSHLSTHTGEKPYVCKVCDQKFNRRSSLRRHLRNHTVEKPHVCGVCDKAFNQPSKLTNHMKTHSGVKDQFTCAHCGKSYARNGYLKRHLIKCLKEHDLLQDRFDDH